ncbi:MAG: hypothetical protein EOO62_18795 [Hymenobacter sp.]|nr:MAG: hypothetical protein EOO62_18795 [Hymenobacter sp.]
MRAVVRRYDCSASEDLSTYEVDDAPVFGFTLTFAIGSEEGQGEEFFEVLVASAAYLSQLQTTQAPAFLRHVILSSDYNIPAAVTLVEKYISSLEEESWEKLAAKINRVLRWEFEDYTA